jgi:acetyl-CoA C-acetyltransferase
MTSPGTSPNGQTYIVSAARTPIGKFGGALAAVPATEQVLQAGAGQAPARQAVPKAGLSGHDLGDDHQLKPLARIVGYAQAEVAPKWLFLAPVEGVRRLLDPIELPIEAFDLIEIHEAFAAQTLADGRELGFDWDKVNVNGGAIALGHPIGASGARIVATLLHELGRRDGRYGLATLCLGGGGSVAMAVERV